MNDQPYPSRPATIIRQYTPETEGSASTALWLEIIFGIFSFMGVGHAYSGRIWLGIALMFGWWLYIFIAVILSTVTLGFGLCLFVPIYFAVPILSGIQARTYVLREGRKGNWGGAALVAGGGCLLVAIVLTVLVVLGILAALGSQYYQR